MVGKTIILLAVMAVGAISEAAIVVAPPAVAA